MAKYLYNGVLLPEIPADDLSTKPYGFIYKDATEGYYYFGVCKYIWYYNEKNSTTKYITCADSYASTKYYRIPIDFVESDTWKYIKDSTGSITFSETLTLVWSNFDIPKGSATATNIYFYASEPIEPTAPEEPTEEVFYKISGARLTDIANAIRCKTGKADPLTLEQMATEIEGIEAGGIPENARLYYVGNAVSETALRVESENNAVGVLE